MFLLGVAAGVIVVAIAKAGLPTHKLWLLGIPLVAGPLGLLSLRKALRLAAPPGDASGFEKRYWKMWLVMILMGAPLGMVLAIPSLPQTGEKLSADLFLRPFANGPLSPALAAVLALGGLALCTVAFVIYHRTVDEQEEHGYLWGSQIAFYFLAVAIPMWWVLQRGGIVPALTIGIAMALVLVSFVIQAAVWGWFKFR
jgi:hypothetical protein